MKANNINDTALIQELEERRLLKNKLKADAATMEEAGQYSNAISLLRQARSLCIYASDGLNVKVDSELSDYSEWNILNDRINELSLKA